MMKLLTAVLSCAAFLVAGDLALAKNDQGKGPQQGQEHGKGHKHAHKNAHNLLGDKLKHDGKHGLGKLGDRDVSADVKNGKVVNMAAGDLPVKRVKSKEKMAVLNGLLVPVAWNGSYQLAEYDDYYYGYCFDDGYDYTCYWYPASDVDYEDYTWDDYDPYY